MIERFAQVSMPRSEFVALLSDSLTETNRIDRSWLLDQANQDSSFAWGAFTLLRDGVPCRCPTRATFGPTNDNRLDAFIADYDEKMMCRFNALTGIVDLT